MTEKKDTRNIHQRLLAAQIAIGVIGKQKPKGIQYEVVPHDDVTRACKGPLEANGVRYGASVSDFIHDGNVCEMMVNVAFVNVDDPADTIITTIPGLGVDNDPGKAVGKAISYAVKYALLKTLGLETGEDVDLHASPKDPQPKPGKMSKVKPTKDNTPEGMRVSVREGFEYLKLTDKNQIDVLHWVFGPNVHDIEELDDEEQLPGFLETLRGWVKDRAKLDEILNNEAF